jgi:hypothetical protein
MDMQKQEMREAVELPLSHFDLYKQIGIDPPRSGHALRNDTVMRWIEGFWEIFLIETMREFGPTTLGFNTGIGKQNNDLFHFPQENFPTILRPFG